MMKPTIHLNGSDAQTLEDNFTAAAKAVDNARSELLLTCPHGRDYYVQGEGAAKVAMAEFETRQKRLNSVYLELVELANYVYAERMKRDRPQR
jgi:hypothetical protein